MPLIQSLSTPTCHQNWYADDSEWFEKLCLMGPKYGYYPKPKKTILIVDKEYNSEAHAQFDHLGVRVVRGHHFLGGFIGGLEATNQFLQGKVKEWTTLSDAAKFNP